MRPAAALTLFPLENSAKIAQLKRDLLEPLDTPTLDADKTIETLVLIAQQLRQDSDDHTVPYQAIIEELRNKLEPIVFAPEFQEFRETNVEYANFLVFITAFNAGTDEELGKSVDDIFAEVQKNSISQKIHKSADPSLFEEGTKGVYRSATAEKLRTIITQAKECMTRGELALTKAAAASG